ncbi:MAG: response regulator [Sediminicola sp.]|tara:strand:+ start:130651 stop:131073 length:423 start_codon:yes stop_codon:yes gene_type:complete
MSRAGVIVAIEDDIDDQEILESIVRELQVNNPIKWFPDTKSAFTYLLTTQDDIFLIFCDINLPGKNGLQFKKEIDANKELRKKSIPFVFLSTFAYQSDVAEAYTEMTVQGFFKKGTNYQEMKAMIATIFEYWKMSQHPNT